MYTSFIAGQESDLSTLWRFGLCMNRASGDTIADLLVFLDFQTWALFTIGDFDFGSAKPIRSSFAR